MPGNFSHPHFLAHFKKLGFKLTLPGLCAGFAEAARIYFLMGNNNFFRLKKLIQYLAFSTPEEIHAEIKSIHLIKDQEEVVTLLKEIPEFFETVSMFAQPFLYQSELGQTISQPKVSAINAFVEKKKYPSLNSTKLLSFPMILDYQDKLMEEYLKILAYIAKIASLSPPVRISICLDSIEHRVMLGFDGKENQWFMCDINQLKNLGTPMTFSQVPQSIFKALNEKYQNNCIGFDTAIYCAAGDVDRFEPILACLNREANALYKKNYFQLLHKKTPKNVTIMHLAAKFGYANMMKELVYIHPTLRDKTAKGVTPLEVAVEQKQQEVAQVLSQSLLDEELLTRQIGKLQLK